MNFLDTNYFVHSIDEVNKLQNNLSDHHHEVSAKPVEVIHNNKKYTLVASYFPETSTLDLVKDALLAGITFGCCEPLEPRRVSIYLENPSEKIQISSPQDLKNPSIASVMVIGNQAPYNAFTDLISYKGNLMCCFRKSVDQQVGDNGTIGIVSSKNDVQWSQVANLTLKGYDLRDPKLSQMPDGRLMLNMGATLWGPNSEETLNSAVSFSDDGVNWSPVQLISSPGSWIWRVTWNNGVAYGTAYTFDQTTGTSTLNIVTSTDGINYTPLVNLNVPENPTETTVRFLADNTMVALVRRNNGTGLIGTSQPPYQDWEWKDTGSVLGGPDFIILPDNSMWASSRQLNGSNETCILAKMSLSSYQPVLTLPSSGDSGYPGMVFQNNNLLISYYSSQTGKSLVYRAIVKFS